MSPQETVKAGLAGENQLRRGPYPAQGLASGLLPPLLVLAFAPLTGLPPFALSPRV
jgi:hypothetical protein